MAHKSERQAKILEIINSASVATQAQLARRLKAAGLPCTQASVSRDIHELGLVKREGHYVADAEGVAALRIPELGDTVRRFLVDAVRVGDNLVVVKTYPGTANGFAIFLDRSGWPGLVGTIAGDDTLFLAMRNRAAAKSVERHLLALLAERAA
jgi:transcriptional regulator of arginine metabolism